MCLGYLTPSEELMCQRGNKLYLFWFDPLRRRGQAWWGQCSPALASGWSGLSLHLRT